MRAEQLMCLNNRILGECFIIVDSLFIVASIICVRFSVWFLQTVWSHNRAYRTSVLFWNQTVWQSDSVSDFEKVTLTNNKQTTRKA